MDKLPNVDPEPEIPKETQNTEVAPPPQIEVIVNDEEDIVPHQEIFKEVPQQEPVQKKKRKPSQAQLDNLAKMRVKRAENRAKAKKEAEDSQKIPTNATPVIKQTPAIQEAPKMPNMNDGFVGFLDYMERYKSLKDNWKKREIEKAKKYVAKQEPQTVPQKKPEKQSVKKTPKNPPSLLTNHSTNNNTYSDYF